MPNKFTLPKDTARIIENEIIKKWHDSKKYVNPSLLFSRYMFDVRKKQKREHLNKVKENIETYFKNEKKEALIKKRKEIIEKLGKLTYRQKSLKFVLKSRMVIGLGASHPEETSILLHHIYGIPYLPGSAVKGVTRNFTILEFATENREDVNNIKKFLEDNEELKRNEELKKKIENYKIEENIGKRITAKEAKQIFGTQKEEGKIIFLDAYPENLKIGIDVMTPHFPMYYSSNEPPADWQTPVPIPFLCVEEGSIFKIFLLSNDNNLLEKAALLVKKALEELGIGAKRMVGYGWGEVY